MANMRKTRQAVINPTSSIYCNQQGTPMTRSGLLNSFVMDDIRQGSFKETIRYEKQKSKKQENPENREGSRRIKREEEDVEIQALAEQMSLLINTIETFTGEFQFLAEKIANIKSKKLTSINQQCFDIRDQEFLVELPEELSESKVREWISRVFKFVFSAAFHALSEQRLSIKQTKMFCAENVLKNIVYCSQQRKLTSEHLAAIDFFVGGSVLPYLSQKYPISESTDASRQFNELVKEFAVSGAASSNYIEGSGVAWELRESGIYNDLIMRTMNEVLDRMDRPSKYEFESRSNYRDFEKMMLGMCATIEDYDVMVIGEANYEKYVLKLIIELFYLKIGQRDPEMQTRQESSPAKREESPLDEERRRESYRAAVRQYTEYSVGRKAPEGTRTYSEKEAQTMNITFKSPAVLRILEEWCDELLEKFRQPNYFQNKLVSVWSQKGEGTGSLLLSMRKLLDQLMAEEKLAIDEFMAHITLGNYRVEQLLLERKQVVEGHEFADEVEWAAASFSLDMIKNFQNYLVSYLNRLIHGLLTVAKRFSSRVQEEHPEWSSPPNLLTFTLGDLMHCRISSREKELTKILKHLRQMQTVHSERLSIVRVRNRLNSPARDISLSLRFNRLINCEVNLSFSHQSSSSLKVLNQFSHFIEELQNSTFGPLVKLCHVWVSLDNRFTSYEKLLIKSFNPSLLEDSQIIRKCINHETIPFDEPFICCVCQKTYSHNYYIKEHRHCKQCGKTYCAKCVIFSDLKNYASRLKNAFIADNALRNDCGDAVRSVHRLSDFPRRGVCIQIESKVPRAEAFELYDYLGQKYLLGKSGKEIYEIGRLSSTEEAQSFIDRYIVFRASLSPMEEQEAKVGYILPRVLSENLREQSGQLMVSEQLDDKALDELLLKLPAGGRTGVRQLFLDNNRITYASALAEHLPNVELLQLSYNSGVQLEGLGKFCRLRHLLLEHCSLIQLANCVFELRSLERLRVSHNMLTVLSQKVGDLEELKSLEIGSNRLTALPKELSRCTNLRTLMCEQNEQLKAIPPELGSLIKLKQLSASNTGLQSFPAQLCRLKSLELLSLDHNRLAYLPQQFGELGSLIELNLSHNRLEELTFEFKKFQGLQKLNLSHNSELSSLPRDMGECQALTELYLEQCRFQQMPSELGRLRSLKWLSLRGNGMLTISESFHRLSSLEWVDLSSNKLNNDQSDRIVYAFKEMGDLRQVNLSNNECTVMPNFSLCKRLRKISMSYNGLNVLKSKDTDGLSSLQYLNLSCNQIEYVQQGLINLQSLVELNLSQNYITSLDSLSSSTLFRKWPNLQILDISKNKLSAFPLALIQSSRMRILRLNENKLRELPDNFFSMNNLQELDLADNEISQMSRIVKLDRLRTLNIKSGKIRQLPLDLKEWVIQKRIKCDLL